MVVILPYCIKAKRCEHNALGYWSGLALCLTKVRSSRACCPATALILIHSFFSLKTRIFFLQIALILFLLFETLGLFMQIALIFSDTPFLWP